MTSTLKLWLTAVVEKNLNLMVKAQARAHRERVAEEELMEFPPFLSFVETLMPLS